MSSVDSIIITNTDVTNQIEITSSTGITVTTVGTQGLAGPSAIMARGIDQTTATSTNNGALLVYDHGNEKWTASNTTEGQLLTQLIYNLQLGGSGATVTTILDEDNMASDSATALATQQSIKAYVDNELTAADLDLTDGDGNNLSIDLDSQVLGLIGGDGIDSTISSTNFTFDLDSTVARLTSAQTLTNKTLTSPVLNGSLSGTAFLDEDNFSSNSDVAVASQQSIKAYVDAAITAEDLDITDGTEIGSIDLDSEIMGILGGTGLTSNLSGNNFTLAIDSTVATLTGTQTLTNKTLTQPIIATISNTGTITLPTSTDTLVGRATTDTLTNKTLTAPKLNGSTPITATGTEVNVLDGDTSASAVVIVDEDQIIVNDNGTMKQVAVTRLDNYVSGTTKTLTNKTLTAPVINSGVINTGLSGTAFLDEDDMSSNSATKVASQQSIKAYVDSQVTAQDLDITDGTTTIAIDLDSETLSLLGSTGIDATASGNGVTFAIDSTVATLADAQTFTNKTIDLDNNTLSNIEVDNFKSGVLDTDLNSVAATDTTIASAKAIKTYVDANITAQDLDITDGSTTIAIDLDSETLSLLGGTGVTSTASGNGVTFAIGQSVGTTDDVVFNQVTGALVGNSSTATALATARAIALSGDVVGTANFDGTAGISISTTIQANSVALGTDTTGSYVSSLVAGTGITLANNSGETATPTISIGQAVGTTDDVEFGTVTASLSGNASTATALETGRTIALAGDVVASGVSFDGTGNISLSTTIQPNSVALGTDTTGSYIATVTGTANEIEVSGSGSESATITIGLPNDVTISGDLTVNGTTTTVDTSELHVTDPLIKLAKDNTANSLDIGFYGQYRASGSTNQFTGLFRDTNDSKYKLFELLEDEPTTVVNISGTGYQTATLVANFEGNITGDLTGTIQTAAQANITSLGTLTALQVDNININGNTISSTAGTDLHITPLTGQQIVLDDTINVDAGVVTGATSITSTAFVGALTGNASTATTLETARTIGGVSFDGSANIDLAGVNTTGNQDTTGNAATATALETARDIALAGDVVGSASFDGTGNISITSTIQANSVALGTDTTGDYVESLVAGTGVTLSNNSGEGSTPTVAIGQAVATSDDVTFNTVTADIIGNINGATEFSAQAGEALTKGDAVYISGISGNTPIVSKADADDSNKMPSFGLAKADASLNSNVVVVTFGTLAGLDTSSFSAGDILFIGTTAGGLTATAPTGETSLLQNIGIVQRSHASAGSIKVGGAGRTNATPNLNNGKIFLGNGSNQAVSTTLDTSVVPENTNLYYTDTRVQAVSINNVVEDTTPQLGGNLDVNGNAITGSTVQINGAGGELMISATENGPVALRYDNNLKLSTKSDGVDITGELQSDSLDVDGDADISGDLNVVGSTTSSSFIGDVTGNADTATTLETARTIGGTSFDGSANINVALADTATALATARTIGGVSFDGTANIDLAGVNTTGNQDTSGNAATATTLATARTINGVSFDGSANITTLTAGTGVSVSGTAVSIGQSVATSVSPTFANMTLNGTDSVKVPSGTTAQRNGSPVNGMFRYNSTNAEFEGYQDGAWGAIAGGGGASAMETDNFTGDGSTTDFTLSSSVASEDNLIVFIEGVFQNKATYAASGTTIAFATAPANTRKIVVFHVRTSISGTSMVQDSFTGDGSTDAYTLSALPNNENNTFVYIDGVYQHKNTYSTSGTTLTFDTAPANSAAIEVMMFAQTTINVPASNSVTTSTIADGNVTTVKINDDAVTLAKMAALTRGSLIVGDASGNPSALAAGSANYVLTSDGTDISWAANDGVTTINNNADNRIITGSGTANTLNGESGLTYDGSTLIVTGAITSDSAITSLTNFNSTSGNDLRLNAGSANRDIFMQVNGTTHMTVQGSTGNVGINTTSPAYNLEVWGATDPAVRVYNTGTGSSDDSLLRLQIAGTTARNFIYFGDSGDSDIGKIEYNHSDNSMRVTTNTAEAFRVHSSGAISVGSDETYGLFNVEGSINFNGNIRPNANTDGGSESAPTICVGYDNDTGFFHPTSNTIGFTTLGTERMRINSAGKVGIGTDSPSSILHIEGDTNGYGTAPILYFGSISTANSAVRDWAIGPADSNYGDFHIYQGASTGASPLATSNAKLTINASGNVGINTATPASYDNNAAGISSNLVVKDSGHSGIVVISGTSSDAAISFGDGTGAAAYRGAIAYVNSQDKLYFKSAGSNRMVIDSSGHLLVGKTSAAVATQGTEIRSNGEFFSTIGNAFTTLHVYSTAGAYRFYVTGAGQIHATSTSISSLSDERLKENIVDLETGLSEVMALQPRRFDWKNGDKTNVAGFIAQEVETVLPDLIDGFKDESIEDAKGVRMGDMLPTLVKAIQEQQTIIEAQATTITDLTNRIETLEG